MRHSSPVRASLSASALLLAASTGAAQAGDGVDLPDMSSLIPSGVRVTVGGAAVMQPKFEGAARYQMSILPTLEFKPTGGSSALNALSQFDINTADDLSLTAYKQDHISFGPLTGFRSARGENLSPRLAGMGDVKGGLVAGGFAKYDMGLWSFRTSLHQDIAHAHTGLVARFVAGTKIPVGDRLVIKTDLTLDYADSTYMTTYFGVSPGQSVTSGHQSFAPSAGFKSAGLLLSTDYKLTADWTLLSSVGYTRLLGDAAKSPIVETANRYEFRLGATRTFDWSPR